MAYNNEGIVLECKGCDRVIYSVVLKKKICSCHIYPKTQWWFDQRCDQATHYPPIKPLEDPIKEP